MDAWSTEFREALLLALDAVLFVEPTDAHGLCPWCSVIRADWTTMVEPHRPDCEWQELADLFGSVSPWIHHPVGGESLEPLESLEPIFE